MILSFQPYFRRMLLALILCLVLQNMVAQESGFTVNIKPSGILPLSTVKTPYIDWKFEEFVDLEALDPKAFKGVVYKLTLRKDAKADNPHRMLFESNECQSFHDYMTPVYWNSKKRFYCVRTLPDDESSNAIYIFLEHRHLQMRSLTSECVNKIATDFLKLTNLREVDITVVSENFDLSTISYVPEHLSGEFRIASDSCKRETAIDVTILRLLIVYEGREIEEEGILQQMVLALHTLLNGMKDLLQIEQGQSHKVDKMAVIPFYFYFKKDSAEAEQLKEFSQKAMDLTSGVFPQIKFLLIPSVYAQRCEHSSDPYPFQVASFEAEVLLTETMSRMEGLLNAEERPNKDLEALVRTDIRKFVESQFPNGPVFKSTTVDYFLARGNKLEIAFHVNLDGYRVGMDILDTLGEKPSRSEKLSNIILKSAFLTEKRIICSRPESIKLDILVPPETS